MERRISLDELAMGLMAAKQYHDRFREPVRFQEEILASSMSSEFGLHQRYTEVKEKYVHTLLALLLPQMLGPDGTLSVRGSGDELSEDAADGLPHTMRKIQKEACYDLEREQKLTDTIIGWGCAEIRMEDSRMDQTRKLVVPTPRHIHPEDLLIMPGARRWEHCSAFFRRRVESREWLLNMAEEAGDWNLEVIRALPTARQSQLTYEDDDLVEYWEGWARPVEKTHPNLKEMSGPADEHDGVRFWISESGEHLRDMEHHHGLKGTPYVAYGAMRTTSCPYPQGIAVASATQALDVEAMIATIEERVDAMQNLVFAATSEADLEQRIEQKIGGVVPMGSNFDKAMVQEVRIDGPRAEHWAWLESRRQQLDEVSGLSDFQPQQLGNRASATEASMRRDAANNRLDGLLNAMYRSDRRLMEMQGFYLVTRKDVKIPMGPDAAEKLGLKNPVWEGGLPDGRTYESLGLEFGVSKSHRLSPQLMLQRYSTAMDLAIRASALKERFPDTNIEDLMGEVFVSSEVPEFRNLLFGDPAPEAAPAQQTPQTAGPDARGIPQIAGGGPVGIVQ